MNEKIIRKSKWFWAWQDDKEEEWLGEMSRQGFHLQHAGVFGQYSFKQGEPREFAYRLDFVVNAKKNPDYYQLFRDAGWEHVGELGGWQYWRKKVMDGNIPEIFTDNASKIQKYQRLIGWLIIFFPIYVVLLINHDNSAYLHNHGFIGLFYNITFFVLFAVVVAVAFSMVKIIQRISALKRK